MSLGLPSTFSDRFKQSSQGSANNPYRILVQSNAEGGGGSEKQSLSVQGWLPEEITFDVAAQYEAPYAQGFNGAFPVLGGIMRALGVSLVTQGMTAQIWQGSTDINFQVPIVFQAETNAYDDIIKPIKNLLKLTMPRDPEGGGLLESPGPRINVERLKGLVQTVSNLPLPKPQQDTQGTRSTLPNNDTGNRTQSMLGGVQNAITEQFKSANEKLTGLMSIGNTPISTRILDTSADLAIGAKNVANKGAVALNTALVNAIDNNISLYIGQFLFFPSVVITDVSQAYNVLIAPDRNPSRATVNVTFRTFYIPTQRDLDVMFPLSSASAGDTLAGGSGGQGDFSNEIYSQEGE